MKQAILQSDSSYIYYCTAAYDGTTDIPKRVAWTDTGASKEISYVRTKRVINIGTNPDDGTGDLLPDALNKVNLNFDDVWEYTSVNSNLNITGDSINGTTDVIINLQILVHSK